MLRALGNLFTHPCRSNTFYWEPDRKGEPRVKRRTATKKHLGALQRMRDWVREHRDQKLSRMMKTLKAKLQGTWNYYGVIGNYRRMNSSTMRPAGPFTMAQPAESAQEPDLARDESFAGTLPSAATAHHGKEWGYALPNGTEFLPTDAGVSTPRVGFDGECESELI